MEVMENKEGEITDYLTWRRRRKKDVALRRLDGGDSVMRLRF